MSWSHFKDGDGRKLSRSRGQHQTNLPTKDLTPFCCFSRKVKTALSLRSATYRVRRQKFVEEVRKVHPDTIFNWVCFENDVATANTNCRNDPKRSKEMSEGNVLLNERWTHLYEYPKGAIVLKIFRLPPADRQSRLSSNSLKV